MRCADLALDDRLGAAGLLAARRGAVEDVEAVADGRQRVAQLVREHGQKLVLALVVLGEPSVGLAQRLLGPLALR